MTVTGLIAEYNPFHNGHAYHIRKARKITGAARCLVVMSGNFVQRGMPAVFDKYSRTEAALRNGADMVLELPVYYATASAEYFARGAIALLSGTGIVDTLCFGSEAGNLQPLSAAADFFLYESNAYKEALKKQLATGLSYPRARQEALKNIGSQELIQAVETPNNILGVEYLKALKTCRSPIIPYTIRRAGAGYHDTSAALAMASATALRKALDQNNFTALWRNTPKNCHETMKNELLSLNAPVHIDNYSLIFHYIMKTHSVNTLSEIFDMDEGLENRIVQLAGRHYYMTNLLAALKNKRVTMVKLQRALLHMLLNIRKEDFAQTEDAGGPQYLRVLGFRRDSVDLFKEIEKKATLPLVTNIKNAGRVLSPLGMKMLEKEIETTDIYYLGQKSSVSSPKPKKYEYQKPLVIV